MRLRKKFRFSSYMEATKAKQPNTNQYKPGSQTYGFHNKLSVFWIFPLISNLHNSRLGAKLQGRWTNYFFNWMYLHWVTACFIQHLGLQQLPHYTNRKTYQKTPEQPSHTKGRKSERKRFILVGQHGCCFAHSFYFLTWLTFAWRSCLYKDV